MQCSNGSHCRRLNLTNGHGFELIIEGRVDDSGVPMSEAGKRHPFVLDTDIIVATQEMSETAQQNISWFGVCSAARYKGESITLQPDTSKGEPKDKKNVNGIKCRPVVSKFWEEVEETITITGPNGAGHPLTTDSFLMCDACGGYISFVNMKGEKSDGTDYWDEQDKMRE